MSFGKPTGPPASHRRVAELLSLLQNAGHTDFRDARGPMGFTQRQAAGKFTGDEVEAFIAQLEQAEYDGTTIAAAPPVERLSAAERTVRDMPAELLAGELQRRGWGVIEP